MKKGKDLAAVLLCLCLAAAGLSACGKAKEAAPPETEALPEESTEAAQTEPETKVWETEETKETETESAEAEKPDIPSPASCGKLSVAGTQLVDENGKAVQLRGLSTHGLSFFPQYVNEELFGELRREWKANVVRLAMYTAESGGYCTDGDKEALKELVRNGVEYAANQDMYVIVDWHILSDLDPNRYKAEALDFFAEMSKEFSGHNNVIYEICNEPNGGTSWAAIKSYAEEVIPVIRANDPDAVILVGTPNWSQYVNEAAADPITGYDNIMYTLHFYAATHTDGLRNTMTAAIDAGLPVFVSEYGICDASGNGGIDEAQAEAWVQVMDQYGVSYVAWNISNKNETSAIIKSTVEKTSGLTADDLSDSGRWLYRTLTEGGGSLPGGGTQETQAGVVPPVSGGQSAGSSASRENGVISASGEIEISAKVVNNWESDDRKFYQYEMTVTNTSDQPCQSWAAEVKFNGDISVSDGWNGRYLAEGDTLYLSSVDYNGALPAGGSTGDVGVILSSEKELEIEAP